MPQLDLFDEKSTVTIPRDPNVHPREIPRLSHQCLKILDRLRLGRATNTELAKLALNYTGRISDLRAKGYEIQAVRDEFDSGLVKYELTGIPVWDRNIR